MLAGLTLLLCCDLLLKEGGEEEVEEVAPESVRELAFILTNKFSSPAITKYSNLFCRQILVQIA